MNLVVSVVIPVYNVEKYLYQCIESVINQSYRNLDIIIIDDGSTDNSGYIEFLISIVHKAKLYFRDVSVFEYEIIPCIGMYINDAANIKCLYKESQLVKFAEQIIPDIFSDIPTLKLSNMHHYFIFTRMIDITI